MLNMLERFDLAGMGFLSTGALHHMIETKRLAFEDRARYYGDPAFSKLPIAWLISKDYAAERAALIRPDRMLVPAYAGEAPGQGDTTYLCAADADGMMVSLIQSNFNGMGSGLSPDGLGFMFQNRGRAFSLEDGHPNLYAPGKRPFHTIIPGFATRDGEPWLAFGVMGGNMQPQGQTQIITDLVDFGLGLQEAGDAPRWLHEFSTEPNGAKELPSNVPEAHRPKGVLALESGTPRATRDGLAALGHIIADAPGGYGGYQAIERLPGRYAAASEMRKDGAALAY
jgi:gamma-glutamyltranspeptidase/glutathione hydrolase